MERELIQMEDPAFTKSSSHSATASITVAPAGLACTMELFLGPNQTTKTVTSGPIAFTSTGAPQNVVLPVVMPAVGGVTYHVYLDVIVAGALTGYQASEDVIIPNVGNPVITW